MLMQLVLDLEEDRIFGTEFRGEKCRLLKKPIPTKSYVLEEADELEKQQADDVFYEDIGFFQGRK